MRWMLCTLIWSVAAPAWAGTVTELVGAELGAREARLELLRQQRPELVEAVWEAEPVGQTRNGRPRFLQEAFLDPAAWPAIEDRLLHGDDPLPVKQGLLAALPLAERWIGVASGLLRDLEDASLRADVIDVVGRSRREEASPVLVRGLADPAAAVRTSAARGLASVPGGGVELLSALKDADPGVRAAAAWSVGVRGEAVAVVDLRGLLADADAEVRLSALRSLERLIGPRIVDLLELQPLRIDPDLRVQQRANALLAR